jgi:hypothetical protein
VPQDAIRLETFAEKQNSINMTKHDRGGGCLVFRLAKMIFLCLDIYMRSKFSLDIIADQFLA